MPKPFNHLRAFRRRVGLRQVDLAALMNRDCSNICRNERRKTEPCLRSAIRLVIILQVPIEDLFPGIFESERLQISKRLRVLIRRSRASIATTQSSDVGGALDRLESVLSRSSKNQA